MKICFPAKSISFATENIFPCNSTSFVTDNIFACKKYKLCNWNIYPCKRTTLSLKLYFPASFSQWKYFSLQKVQALSLKLFFPAKVTSVVTENIYPCNSTSFVTAIFFVWLVVVKELRKIGVSQSEKSYSENAAAWRVANMNMSQPITICKYTRV